MDKKGSIVRFLFVLSMFVTGWLYADQSVAALSLTTEIAEKQVKHDYSDTSAPDSGALFRGNIGTIIIGANYSQGRFFSSLNLDQSWKDDVTFLPGDVLLFLDRIDYALTFGYSIFTGATVFAGYKYGETTISGVGIASPGANDLSFIEEGPFIGMSYSLPVSSKSLLGFSLAYADLDAETENRIDPLGGSGAGPAEASGTADGFSAGVMWSYELSESTLLNIGYKVNSYDAEGTNKASDEYSLKSDYEFITFGLRHYF